MSISIDDAIAHLYQLAVVEGNTQSTQRLARLADFCVQELEARGLKGASKETTIPGIGRDKKWDIAWKYNGKVRLGISLKSILKNISGTVPNRIDDLMGEVANVQLHSPEIVVGYIMVFDKNADSISTRYGQSWINVFRSYIDSLSNRRPPAWAPGTIEAYVVAEADLKDPPGLVSSPRAFDAFFDRLSEAVVERNPALATVIRPTDEPLDT